MASSDKTSVDISAAMIVEPVALADWLVIAPLVGRSRSAIRRSSVVLPQPDGPSRVKNSLSRMSKVTLLSAVKSPKSLRTSPSDTAALLVASVTLRTLFPIEAR